jgi:leucyl-tRNA synthetase
MSAAEGASSAPKSFARRDHLREHEKVAQELWAREKTFEVQPAYNEDGSPKPKFLVTFPYPYMNGRLHLGHAFSLTKAEFTARFQKLLGKNVCFPFAFHSTGMPIQAAATKLREELATYGCPPVFPVPAADDLPPAPVEEKSAAEQIAAKSKGKKSKLAVKGHVATVRQWDILAMMVPLEEIPEFVNPVKWIEYFPPFGATDMQSFGCAVDWRRSFVTTSYNQFYDAFVRWQFNKLREGNRIKFGKRPNVYSPKDGQVCADHDRASGETVVPQEYTLVKLRIIDYSKCAPLADCVALAGRDVFLAPATLRPETMYGQTNCFVLPEGDYGAYEIVTGDVLIMAHRAAVGLAHQGMIEPWGVATALCSMKGMDLMGLPLSAPNAPYEVIYTLPLLTISMSKGTGVVTSVPSDSPDDFVALRELKDKPLWREKFGLTTEMVEPFEVVPIIEIEGYGNTSAVTMCERLSIRSPKDADLLKKAKDEVYLKGYYEGVMIVGECKGMKVIDAKPIVRASLLAAGHGLPYFEPESTVISRTGDECVVALSDQWYLSYGDEEWKAVVASHIHSDNFTGYNDRIMELMDGALDWLGEWACSRMFGLGTQLPWDVKWVIESLSDSTIYMAYYTIAHHFHGGIDNMSGHHAASPSGISADQLTDEVFDYIFLAKAVPATTIPVATLTEMKKEFEYWYPMDLRVSAKDLIPNHLTMSLYNHAEIWKDRPELWPKGIYCNGHIMVDAEKMSKSKGNFLMMEQCVMDYSADATRFALADAGDSVEDANFDRSVANIAILAMDKEEVWIKEVLAEGFALRDSSSELLFMDTVFLNEVYHLSAVVRDRFESMCYRDGLQKIWFELLISRDMYRDWSLRCNVPMRADVLNTFLEALIIGMSPIIPHWCEAMWGVMGKSGAVCNTSWPVYPAYDVMLRKQYVFFREFIKSARGFQLKAKEAMRKKMTVYIASTYEDKKIEVLHFMATLVSPASGALPPDFIPQLKAFLDGKAEWKKESKSLMQFGAFMRSEAEAMGPDALAVVLPFDQQRILEDNKAYLMASFELEEVVFVNIHEAGVVGDKKKIESATPGKPSCQFFA